MIRPTLLRAALAALLLLPLAGCRRAVPLETTTPVTLATSYDPEAVRAALIRALDERSFNHQEVAPGRIVAHMRHRAITLDLGIDYDAAGYRITYLGSSGLDQRTTEDGSQVISRRYYQYLDRLERTIADELERPAREAAEAVEREREHQLALAREESDRERAALDAEAAERERQREAELERERLVNERERLRVARARAQADANRPVIVQTVEPAPVVVRETRRPVARHATVTTAYEGGDTQALRGVAGGPHAALDLGFSASCRGWFDEVPQHVIELPRWHGALRIETEAAGDVTLLVAADDGTAWCDDDGAGGTDALVWGRFAPGSYRVFVGSYDRGRRTRYRLLVGDNVAAQVAVAEPPAPPPAPDCRQVVLGAGHHPSHLVHCDGAEPRCAAALIGAGHHPSHLVHCRGVEPSCAESLIRNGQHPSHLVHCRQ